MTDHNSPFLDPFLEELAEGGTDAEHLAAIAASVPPVAPDAKLRTRLMESLVSGRLHRFAETVAELLDVDDDRARVLLDAIDDPASWEDGPADDVTLYHFKGGPAVSEAITGFVRVERGKSFPHHEHLGDEIVMVVQGRVRDSRNGSIAKPGDVVRMPPGSAHQLDVLPGPRVIYLAVIFEGVDIGGVVYRPGDPRI